jgi:hypothetical protein
MQILLREKLELKHNVLLSNLDNLKFTFADSEYELSSFEVSCCINNFAPSVVDFEIKQESWESAKYYCKHRGMELVSIETEEEQIAIVEATSM